MQTYIAYIYNADGDQITFERFSCKKIETVKRHMETLLDNSLYRVCVKGAAWVDIHRTTDNGEVYILPALSFAA